MDEEGERRVRAKSSGDEIGEVDRLSNLPDSLLCHIMLNIPTKDVVKSCVLSKRWRNIWRYVPGLDLGYSDFPEYNAFVGFVDSFLGFSSESCLQKFKLKSQSLKLKYEWKWDEPDAAHITRWINNVIKRKVQQLHFMESTWNGEEVEIPLSIYTCESLVSLKLCDMVLPKPKSVSLPCVKVIYLDLVKFANDWAFEMLISGCPVLESLTLWRNSYDNVKVLRVCSQSLLSFTHFGNCEEDNDEELVVVIDAPRLEYLKLDDHETDSFIINNPVSLVKVKDMVISSDTLEIIYNYSRCEPLPLFRNLSSLYADFNDYRWEMLPIFLESCPNLKSLSLGFSKSPGEEEGVSIFPGPRQFLTSLEYVKIGKPMIEEATEMKLVSYFLENSTILKEFTFLLGDFRKNEESVILRKLLAIPRLSSSCQVLVL